MAEFILNRNLIISNIKEVHEELMDHITQFNHLSITINDNVEVDFSGIQLLYALHRYMQENNKKLTIKYSKTDQATNPFQISEFDELISIKNKIK